MKLWRGRRAALLPLLREPADVSDILTRKEYFRTISPNIDEIDYGALVELFFPLIHDNLAEKGGAVAAIPTKIAGTPPMLAKQTLNFPSKKCAHSVSMISV